MSNQSIETNEAPLAIGTYSQAIRVSNLVFISGQIPLLPGSANLISHDFRAQAEQVFKNMEAICKAAGGSLKDITKLTVYVTNLDNFSLVNEVMKNCFQAPYPARATVEVSALPKGAGIECDAIMALNR